ncbi:MAG: hypothetical protein JXD21_03625 [Candidatus Omnitrophica bacterium]|nr:hypothetical protein [Candidatus Omnitrophota bacterium]
MKSHSLQKNILTAIAVIFILVGALANQWVLVKLFDPDGTIDSFANRAAVWIFDIVMIFSGIFIFRHREKRLNMVLVSRGIAVVIIGLCLGEIILRIGIAAGVPWFRNPDLYADWSSSDEYWKLTNLWQGEQIDRELIDPQLGWAPRKTSANPLGVAAQEAYTPRFDKPAILFYGDSFVYGNTGLSERIPEQLRILLKNTQQVYNYGVRGYGLDQIFLRIKQSYPLFEKPTIVVGLLTTDIDRCVLEVRSGQKPYFLVEDNTLFLKGVPIDLPFSEWIKVHPPQIKSYLLSALNNKSYMFLETMGLVPGRRQQEKEQIASLLIEALSEMTQKEKIPLVFVVFYPEQEIHKTTWREKLLSEELTKRNIPFVDVKQLFLKEISDGQSALSDFYLPDGHPAARANHVIARSVAGVIGRFK